MLRLNYSGWPNYLDRQLLLNAVGRSVVQPPSLVTGSNSVTNSHKLATPLEKETFLDGVPKGT